MDRQCILSEISTLFDTCPGNFITASEAICPEVAGLKLFDSPLAGFGSAFDELFTLFKAPGVVGPWSMSPSEWLESASTVIALFFPFTEQVRKMNRAFSDSPSPAWLHGRIEGQEYLAAYGAALKAWFISMGSDACVPVTDERFVKITAGNNFNEYSCMDKNTFGSNWSERHAAYVCGLGTFGLSKGLITEKGMAGRFISIIISEKITPDRRAYTGIYDNCIQCGACIKRCPVNAISFEKGKDHSLCYAWTRKMGQIYAPRYGCGLCQTGVPCENRNPAKSRS